MKKDDGYYSQALIKDLSYIIRHMSGLTREAFDQNEILQDAMMFRLIQISESARKLTEDFRASYQQIPWGDVYGLRNRIVHDYGTIDLSIVYTTLTEDIPLLWHILAKE